MGGSGKKKIFLANGLSHLYNWP